ncbi:FAD-dependent oxidoreductase [Rhodoplanes sp. Z2-YC6860]|uniref:FAD-dependent oxidoreductase n=1 Tax=Rhodoplanes sp. Z2-YC6860 TaxID=674703 RepID=UPI00078DD252|nr:FAD-dependent oxidoreductase [Rhodoplanes sp. Z2-YC6860]AMN41074.1 FAD-binding monooxygenase [Rhodoplanes sp. Z2-YC6860]
MGQIQRVLIAGGGIAGMSLAIALQRVGISATIVEIDPGWRVYGAGITITGPSLRAFDKLGLLDRIVAEGYCYNATRICGADGSVIVPSRVVGRPLGEHIPNSGGILRPVLHRILSEATRASGAAVRLGVSVARFEQRDEGVSAVLSDGAEFSADLVIGADGIHSGMREMLFPDAPAPALTGQGCWRAVVPRPDEIDCAHVYVGGPVKAGITPVSRTEMYLFLLQHVPDNPRMPEERFPALLAEQLRGFGGALGDIRDALGPASRINYRPLEKLLLPPPWHRGRAVLIGDAAHATTPHLASGAGLAVEDGLVLADLLSSDLALDDALAQFTARRYDRCRMVVENSVRLGELEMGRAAGEEQAALQRSSMLALNAPI